jgi:hypothetical protein
MKIEQIQISLKNGINRSLSDSRIRNIPYDLLYGLVGEDINRIDGLLDEWESKGLLVKLRSIKSSTFGDDCIRMNAYIDMKSPLQGFLNWEE